MIQQRDEEELVVLEIQHGKANAIDLDFFDQLGQCLDTLDDDPRPIVLTGTGKMFSAGVDLFQVLDGGKDYLDRFLPALSGGLRRLFTWPSPVIAAINGHAIAGGCILAAACDRRVMNGDGGKIGVTELMVGVPFPVVALEVLRHLLPTHRVEELVKTGRLLGAEQAQQIGLVDDIAGGDELLDRASQVARQMGKIPPRSFALSKRHLRLPTIERMDRLAELDQEIEYVWSDDETLDGIRSFLEATVGKR